MRNGAGLGSDHPGDRRPSGRSDSVLTTCMLWQHATDAAFKAAIAEATGRRALTVISGFELADDVATEVFLLAPG